MVEKINRVHKFLTVNLRIFHKKQVIPQPLPQTSSTMWDGLLGVVSNIAAPNNSCRNVYSNWQGNPHIKYLLWLWSSRKTGIFAVVFYVVQDL